MISNIFLNVSGRRKFNIYIFSSLAAIALLTACAAPQSKPEQPDKNYVWPKPPSEAVIEFLKVYRSEKDLQKESSWRDALLGQEDQVFGALRTPFSVSTDSLGRILVADNNIPGLMVFDVPNGELTHFGKSGEGQLSQVLGVTAGPSGTIYVADGALKTVKVYQPDGEFIRAIGEQDELGRPVGLAIDEQRGRLYVSDILKHHLAVFDLDGNRVDTIGERGEEEGQFNFPVHLAIDASGLLYVVDSMNFRIQIFNPDGSVVGSFGEQGDGPGTFARPKGIAVDFDGNIYVSDAAFNNVQIFSQDGQLLLVVGREGDGPGGFQLPAGMHSDEEGKLYVTDQLNQRVQVFQYLGAPEIPKEDVIKVVD